MLDPIVKTIEVPCPQQQAFEVFVNEFNTWWPLKYSVSGMGGDIAKSVSIEPKAGGRIVDIGHDDTEHLWGTVNIYDPYALFSMNFHMGVPAPETASVVEVRFTVMSAESTRVELTQGNWEAFGDMAADMHAGYGSAWGNIFEKSYMSACGS